MQSHSQKLAADLEIGPVEACSLLQELGQSLCLKLFPDQVRKKSETARSLERLQRIIDHLSEGVVVADMAGNLLDWNPAALRLHGSASVEEVRRKETRQDALAREQEAVARLRALTGVGLR